jgi:hypothetical protein
MYLIKDLDQIHLLLFTNFCLYFKTEVSIDLLIYFFRQNKPQNHIQTNGIDLI